MPALASFPQGTSSKKLFNQLLLGSLIMSRGGRGVGRGVPAVGRYKVSSELEKQREDAFASIDKAKAQTVRFY